MPLERELRMWGCAVRGVEEKDQKCIPSLVDGAGVDTVIVPTPGGTHQ